MPEPMTDELEPCPFCGGSDLLTEYRIGAAWPSWVECRSCAAMGPRDSDHEAAHREWNRRALPAAVDRIEQQRKQIERLRVIALRCFDELKRLRPEPRHEPWPVECSDCGQWFDAAKAECIQNPLVNDPLTGNTVMPCPHCGDIGLRADTLLAGPRAGERGRG
jgi:Lar family restriction alleviation protein